MLLILRFIFEWRSPRMQTYCPSLRVRFPRKQSSMRPIPARPHVEDYFAFRLAN